VGDFYLNLKPFSTLFQVAIQAQAEEKAKVFPEMRRGLSLSPSHSQNTVIDRASRNRTQLHWFRDSNAPLPVPPINICYGLFFAGGPSPLAFRG
jgi:hypothetical protein